MSEFGRRSELGNTETRERKFLQQTTEEKIVGQLATVSQSDNRMTIHLIAGQGIIVGKLSAVEGKGAEAILTVETDKGSENLSYKDVYSVSGGISTPKDGLSGTHYSQPFSTQLNQADFAQHRNLPKDGL